MVENAIHTRSPSGPGATLGMVVPPPGGPLAAPRDWSASVGLDRTTGVAWGGGYVGDGVGTANLAGRTLADLIRECGLGRTK